jgi:hypothetical protein
MTSKYLTLSVLAVSLAGCTAVRPTTTEHLDWGIGDYVLVFEEGTGWKGLGGEETSSRIYATPGATAEDWTVTLNVLELPIAITLMSETRWNPKSILNAEKARMVERQCTDPWRVLQSDSTSLLYERPAVDCAGYLHQYEIGRIVMGQWYSWWLRYRIRGEALSEDEKSRLISNLAEATVAQ